MKNELHGENSNDECDVELQEECSAKTMFDIVLAAYNAGRIKVTTILYNFLQATINQKSILSKTHFMVFENKMKLVNQIIFIISKIKYNSSEGS